MKTKNNTNTDNFDSSTRFFNTIQNVSKNYIMKTSSYSDKFYDEVTWFSKLPKNIKSFVPKIKNICTTKGNLSITYKLIKTPTLHMNLMNNIDNFKFWCGVKKQYSKFLRVCRQTQIDNFDESYWIEQAEKVYIIKTIERLSLVLKDPDMSFFYKKKFVYINGMQYPSIPTILNFLKQGVKTHYKGDDYKLLWDIIRPKQEDICFIHGDLVFSNVFVYPNLFFGGSNFKCIDPRGSFGENKNFGDICYDYSKIYQCVFGYYDFIIDNKFTFFVNNNNFIYYFHGNNAIAVCKCAFDSLFPKKILKKIRLIESLQFLSMAPLHADKKNHEKIILAHGILRFCGVLQKVWKS